MAVSEHQREQGRLETFLLRVEKMEEPKNEQFPDQDCWQLKKEKNRTKNKSQLTKRKKIPKKKIVKLHKELLKPIF